MSRSIGTEQGIRCGCLENVCHIRSIVQRDEMIAVRKDAISGMQKAHV